MSHYVDTVTALESLDSRDFPTVLVDVVRDDGAGGAACCGA
jgi:enolase